MDFHKEHKDLNSTPDLNSGLNLCTLCILSVLCGKKDF